MTPSEVCVQSLSWWEGRRSYEKHTKQGLQGTGFSSSCCCNFNCQQTTSSACTHCPSWEKKKREIFSLISVSNSIVDVQDNNHLTNARISRVYHNLSSVSIWLSSYFDINNNCAGGTHVQLEGGVPFHLAFSQ